MRTLLIDNYDSFTFNLYQYLAEVNRVAPIVVRNDTAPWEEIRGLDYDNIVISPGPGRPENPADFGICARAILESSVPVLGVCLGHQGLCHLFGGVVDYTQPMHGRTSQVLHDGREIFRDIPSPFSVVRYHSLHVTELPPDLDATAWTQEGILMGVRHRSRPIWGVQFHPESIATEYGHQLLQNFAALTTEHLRSHPPRRRSNERSAPVAHPERYNVIAAQDGMTVTPALAPRASRLRVHFRRLPLALDAEQVFMHLYAGRRPAFWLDSALMRNFSRFSYMGDASGPLAEYLTYRVRDKQVRIRRGADVSTVQVPSFFDYLDEALRSRRVETEGLPFDFNGGFVGYLGYELKAETGGSDAHQADTPDAAFIFADRFVAFDHEQKMVYLVCVDEAGNEARATEWLSAMADRLANLPPAPPRRVFSREATVEQSFRHTADQYLQAILDAQEQIRLGESYEVCLTTMISNHVEIDPLTTYRALRERNPAPYATFLDLPELAVLSSSPERFLTVDTCGVVDAKPIKGTRPRGRTLAEDEALYNDLRTNIKDRSENLMIVDLVRNDLGAVCNFGSVHVPNIFAVESYASVHQLVSSIRGRLRRGVSAVQAVRAAFPAGSMTGAPKKRTMDIIDRLEGGPRGVYSGSLGFFGLNGSADLSVVIRTIVVTEREVTVGVGGAVVALSDPQAELEEMLLKSRATVRALAETADVPLARRPARAG